jgi:hypothetical protein
VLLPKDSIRIIQYSAGAGSWRGNGKIPLPFGLALGKLQTQRKLAAGSNSNSKDILKATLSNSAVSKKLAKAFWRGTPKGLWGKLPGKNKR